MDETYINLKGQWKHYYRTVDKYGCIIDFLLCDHRGEKAARAFFNKAVRPEKVVIDKSDASVLILHNVNVQLWLTGKMLNWIEVFQVKHLNNIVEQSHWKVKGKIHQCQGWKSDEGAKAILTGVEQWSMIENGQFDNPEGLSVQDQLYTMVTSLSM